MFIKTCNPPTPACNRVPYDPGTEECCEGVVVALGQSALCNGVRFDPNMQECCNGQVVPLGQCNPTLCQNGAPPSAGMECCNGVEVPIGQCNPAPCENGAPPSPGMQCCGDTEYEPTTQECCEGVVVPINTCSPTPCANGAPPSPGMECCNGQEFDPTTHDCCDDGTTALNGQCPPPPPPQPCVNAGPDPGMLCCGERQYDPQYEECCNGVRVPLNSCPCVNGNPPEAGFECCNGVQVEIGECQPCRLLPPSPGKDCCEGVEYDLATQICCEGQVVAHESLSVEITPPSEDPAITVSGVGGALDFGVSGASSDIQYVWDFAGGSAETSYGAGPISVTFGNELAGKELTVSVQAIDQCGRTGTDTINVRVVKAVINNVNRGPGLPPSVAPNQTRYVDVEIEPSLEGTSHSISFAVVADEGVTGAGSAGVACLIGDDLKSSGAISVTGGASTDPGSALRLRISAMLDGVSGKIAGKSAGFSVCAHPTTVLCDPDFDDEDSLTALGLTAAMSWRSDSGAADNDDLNEVLVWEQVAESYRDNPPFWTGTMETDLQAYNGTALRILDGNTIGMGCILPLWPHFGKWVFGQLYVFRCARCGMTENSKASIPMSGFAITHYHAEPPGLPPYQHATSKEGYPAAAGGFSSDAGFGSIHTTWHHTW